MSVFIRCAIIVTVFCGGLIAVQATEGNWRSAERREMADSLPPEHSGAARDLRTLVETDPKRIESILHFLEGKGNPGEELNVGERDDYLHNLGIVASVYPQLVSFDRLTTILRGVESDPAMPAQVKADYLVHAYLTIGRFGSPEAIRFLLDRSEVGFWKGQEPRFPFNPPMQGFVSPRLQAIASINVLGNEAENELLRKLKLSPAFKNDNEALQYIQLALDAADERRNDHLALLAAVKKRRLVARPQKSPAQ